MRIKSFKLRLSTAFLALLFLSLTSISVISVLILRELTIKMTRTSLKVESNEVINDILDENMDEPCRYPDKLMDGVCIPAETVKTYNPKNHQSSLIIGRGNDVLFKSTEDKNGTYLKITKNINTPKLKGTYITIGRNISLQMKIIKWFSIAMLILGLLMMFIATLMLYSILKQEFKPLDKLIMKLNELSKHNTKKFEVSIPENSSNEITFLSNSINKLLRKINKLIENQENFISNAAHELRTPLTVISSEAEIALKKRRSNEDYRRSLSLIKNVSIQSSNIIKKLLLMSRLSLDKQKVSFEKIELGEVIYQAVNLVRPDADRKGTNIRLNLNEGLYVNGDRTLLTQMFLNILENAVKYNRENGKIRITARKDNGLILVSIADTGIGMTKDEVKNAFKRFQRFSKSERGLGIGLTIAREIASMHNASISMESEPGMGTTVTITFKQI
ncbi:MAG: GHKL domain-containing protein [Nitrospiraceae bacterium]|nr:GHKL domain-containing protein [Nitrospiraceae bacterium]